MRGFALALCLKYRERENISLLGSFETITTALSFYMIQASLQLQKVIIVFFKKRTIFFEIFLMT